MKKNKRHRKQYKGRGSEVKYVIGKSANMQAKEGDVKLQHLERGGEERGIVRTAGVGRKDG